MMNNSKIQFRKDLIGLSVGLGLIINLIIHKFSSVFIEADCGELCLQHKVGWPFIFDSFNFGFSERYVFLFNLLFWIMIVFMGLNLFKYFKQPKSIKIFNPQSKTSLLAWSVLAGFLISVVIEFKYLNVILGCSDTASDFACHQKFNVLFFPFEYGFIYGLFFWIPTSFVILYLFKYFKTKH